MNSTCRSWDDTAALATRREPYHTEGLEVGRLWDDAQSSLPRRVASIVLGRQLSELAAERILEMIAPTESGASDGAELTQTIPK